MTKKSFMWEKLGQFIVESFVQQEIIHGWSPRKNGRKTFYNQELFHIFWSEFNKIFILFYSIVIFCLKFKENVFLSDLNYS
jgi:hypothetical protein